LVVVASVNPSDGQNSIMKASPVDRILIRDLVVRTTVGPKSGKPLEKQDFVLNLDMAVDLRTACATDALSDSVDYSRVKKRIVAATGGTSFRTIGQLAERVARICLEDPKTRRVRIVLDGQAGLQAAGALGAVVTRARRADKEKPR
jgi:FolB domain-containing protein